MTESTSNQQFSVSVMQMFRETCDKFRELAQSAASTDGSFTSGWQFASQKDGFKLLFRHPIKMGVSGFKMRWLYPSNINALDGRFPTEAMLGFLGRFTEHELQSLKGVTALNLRTHKDRITNNPMLKLSVPVGALYGVIKFGSELGTGSKLSKIISEFFNSLLNDEIGIYYFFFAVGIIIVLILQIAIQILPGIARAQLLDDFVLVALESKQSGNHKTANQTTD